MYSLERSFDNFHSALGLSCVDVTLALAEEPSVFALDMPYPAGLMPLLWISYVLY